MYGWAVFIGGAMLIAITLAKLSAHIQGGPFIYVEEAFGPEIAFIVMWSYLVSVLNLPALILPIGSDQQSQSHRPPSWNTHDCSGERYRHPLADVPGHANGARAAGFVQVLTTVLKALPLIAVLLIAAIYFGRGVPAAPQEHVPIAVGSIAGAASLALFSMLGSSPRRCPRTRSRTRFEPFRSHRSSARY